MFVQVYISPGFVRVKRFVGLEIIRIQPLCIFSLYTFCQYIYIYTLRVDMEFDFNLLLYISDACQCTFFFIIGSILFKSRGRQVYIYRRAARYKLLHLSFMICVALQCADLFVLLGTRLPLLCYTVAANSRLNGLIYIFLIHYFHELCPWPKWYKDSLYLRVCICDADAISSIS